MGRKIVGYGNFYCWNCGRYIEKGKENCPVCGASYQGKNKYKGQEALGAGGIGWSNQGNHPSFKRYVKNYRKVSYIWLAMISILIPGGLLLFGEISLDKEGIAVIIFVPLIFWIVGLIFLHSQFGKNKADWDGVVENKQIFQRTRTVKDEDGYKRKEHYTEFIIFIRRQDGSIYELKESQPTKYEYYKMGDYVHYYGSKYLNYIEKYDKSFDEIIFCVSCSNPNDARNNFCERCGSIILKGGESHVL